MNEFTEQLFAACLAKNWENVKEMLRTPEAKPALSFNDQDQDLRLSDVLIAASGLGQLEVVGSLLEKLKGFAFLDAKMGALQKAGENGHVVVLNALLKEIESLFDSSAANDPLFTAPDDTEHFSAEQVQEIIGFASLGVASGLKQALSTAVEKGHLQVVARILKVPDLFKLVSPLDAIASFDNHERLDMLGWILFEYPDIRKYVKDNNPDLYCRVLKQNKNDRKALITATLSLLCNESFPPELIIQVLVRLIKGQVDRPLACANRLYDHALNRHKMGNSGIPIQDAGVAAQPETLTPVFDGAAQRSVAPRSECVDGPDAKRERPSKDPDPDTDNARFQKMRKRG